MILEKEQLIDNLLKEDLLKITTKNHSRTWEYYYEQYHEAFRVLLEIAKQRRYKTNCKFMPFLFIMRHSLELFLKKKISSSSTALGGWQSHKLTDLCGILYKKDDPNKEKFLEFFDCLKCDSEGDCFRYVLNREGGRHFAQGEKIEAFDACSYYCLFLDNDNSLTEHGISKRLQYELTFHTQECDTLGQVGTQYDFAIIEILKVIQSKQISINDVYLPLLFLLRHTLEIKLKDSITKLGNIVNDEDRATAHSAHSVKVLYEILANHIDGAIESITDPKFKKESEDLCSVTEQYKDTVALLDANSFLFRFPKDKKGNDVNFIPKPDCVSEILKLYWDSDPFLCFSVSALSEYGILTIADDRIE